MSLLPILILIAFTVVSILLGMNVLYGCWIARHRHDREEHLHIHRQLATATWWAALCAILITEAYVRGKGGVQYVKLFTVHLSFALPFFLTLTVLRFWLTGLASPRIHRVLAYGCLCAFAGTLLTGGALLLLPYWQ